MQLPPAAPPRRPSSPSCRALRVSITSSTSRGMRSTSGRPRPCARAWAATTRARRSARRSSAWCLWRPGCALFPLPPCWRRVYGSCATSRHWHRHTTQRRAGKPISTGSCAKQIVPSWSPASASLTYPGHSAPSARVRTLHGRRARSCGRCPRAKTRRPPPSSTRP